MTERIRRRPLMLAAAVLGAVLAIGVVTFAGPCVHDDGSASTCSSAAQVIVALGAGACIAMLAGLALPSESGAGACSIAGALLGALAALLPGNALALCMMHTMRCWLVMQPFALVCGVAILIVGAVQAVLLFRRARS